MIKPIRYYIDLSHKKELIKGENNYLRTIEKFRLYWFNLNTAILLYCYNYVRVLLLILLSFTINYYFGVPMQNRSMNTNRIVPWYKIIWISIPHSPTLSSNHICPCYLSQSILNKIKVRPRLTSSPKEASNKIKQTQGRNSQGAEIVESDEDLY